MRRALWSWIRRRRFRTRLLVPIVGLLALVQLGTYGLITTANERNALAQIDAALDRGARQFHSILARREADLLLAGRVLAGDYAMRQLFLAEEFSPPTVRSALASYRRRIGAPVIVMFDADGYVLAAIGTLAAEENLAPVQALRRRAAEAESYEAVGFGFLEGSLHQLVVVPMFAPPPEVVAWVGIAFPVDGTTAAELKANADLEVTFLAARPAPAVLASTLEPALAGALLPRLPQLPGPRSVPLGRDVYISHWEPLSAGPQPVWVLLQRSLARELAPARRLERIILVITLAGLAAATLAALVLARGVSRPVHQLAAHTRLVGAGDYETRLHLDRGDELGELADAFNAMSQGLAERDRVRDLLDKNVSPAVATQLLRDGAALGGEEREVTILFADLRGFTTLSEQLPPPDLVALLNRYLDRMSRAIEAEGGVIDKFIGDAIMALFGAPLALPDPADRAIRAALGMRAALAQLNAELAHEGRSPLAFGVGINTARVVAGNIGSSRRLNYSVIGDGVNLAARLQGLTRVEAYQTDIIVGDRVLQKTTGPYATRPLGTTQVKGRAEAVTLHAIDGLAVAPPPGSPAARTESTAH